MAPPLSKEGLRAVEKDTELGACYEDVQRSRKHAEMHVQ